MRPSRLLPVLLAVRAVLAAAEPDADLAARVQRDLDRLYAGEQAAVDPAALVAGLSHGDRAARDAAGGYVAAVLAQLAADERNGRAPWRSSPFWGGHAESPARTVRAALAQRLGESADDPAALPAIAWLLAEDPIASDEAAAATALERIDGEAADALIARVAAAGHPNAQVLATVARAAGQRRIAAAADAVAALAAHHRETVRVAAKAAAAQLGVAPRDYDAVAAFVAAFGRDLATIAGEPLTAPPEGDAWRRFVWQDGDRERSVSGWLLAETDSERAVLTWFGEVDRVPAAATATARSLADAADDLLAVRAQAKPGDQPLSRRGGLTGQFEPRFVSVPEALVAAWSFQRGDPATAQRLLEPRIADTADDRWIGWAVRDALGHLCHQQMLSAFANHRDYALALRCARHLAGRAFDDYPFQRRAQALAEQLPTRLDEFATLALPAVAAWPERAKAMAHDDLVRFLADRVRLLSCHQMGQPGGVYWDEPQYAPRPVPTVAGVVPQLGTWFGDGVVLPDAEALINPLAELRRAATEPADVALLAPYLLDDRIVPSFGFWRDFHPNRTTWRVGDIVAWVIDGLALQDLCRRGDYDRDDAAARAARVAAVQAWAREHAGQTRLALARAIVGSATAWDDVAAAARAVAAAHDADGIGALAARADTFPEHVDDIAELCWHGAPAAALEPAARWLRLDTHDASFWAALIRLGAGADDADACVAAIDAALKLHDHLGWWAAAIEPLLAARAPSAAALALRVLERKDLDQQLVFGGAAIVERLVRAHRPEALAWTQRALAGDHADAAARMVAGWLGEAEPTAVDAAQRTRLGAALDARWREAEQPGSPAFPPTLQALPDPGRWRIDAP